MHPVLLMSEADAQGIELFRAGLKLRWEADQQPPSALVEQWRQHRSQLVGWLASEEDAPAPLDFPRQLWPPIIEALSRFEADHEADALTAGWSEAELWSVHRKKPWHRIDHMGAAILTHGKIVVGINDRTITVEGRTGNQLRIYRRASMPPSSTLLDIRELVAAEPARYELDDAMPKAKTLVSW